MRQSAAMAVDITDPRPFPERADAAFDAQIELAASSLGSSSTARAAKLDQTLTRDLVRVLRSGDASWIEGLLAAAPSAEIRRHFWRRLLVAWDDASRTAGEPGLAVTLFALPIVIVAGRSSEAGANGIDAVLRDSARLVAMLREHGALAGNLSFGLANALVAADALDPARLPELLSWTSLSDAHAAAAPALVPAAIPVATGEHAVHLRFLVGTALAATGTDLLSDSQIGAWGLPLAQELARQLATPGVSVLALPRPPQAPLVALQAGRAAQREVGAQLFASNAIRRLRASVGEPAAVVSAHRCATALGGGELRLSLSSAFDPAQAEGFRCPLFPCECAGEVAAMLVDLLHDCRIADVHVLPGVYQDRASGTGQVLLFKADAIAQARNAALQ
jgi:hypothetical protein